MTFSLVSALPLALALAAAPDPGAPNLLLVTIDTLRADRVGAYGHRAAATPVLDRLAREGLLVENAVVAVPQTRPSHASLFTGRQPYEHGLRDNASGPLGARWPTLAALLQSAGYDTGAAIGAYPVSRPSGLDRGFASFDDPFGGYEQDTTRTGRTERRAAEVVDRAVEWLGRRRAAPFFLWVHLFDPHAPYEAPEPWGSRFARDPYDGEVAYADAQVGRLLSALDALGERRRTLVVVTSDHGEGLGEHGEQEHMLLVYDSTLRVPLVFSWPGRLPAGRRIPGQFRAVDLLPTLLELLGRPPVETSGVSRAAELRDGSRLPDNEAYAESLYGQIHYGWAPLRAVRSERWKYIDAPRPELYHLGEDPGETRNRMDDRTRADIMRGELLGYDHEPAPAALPAVDAETLERLAALGYVGEGAGGGGTPSGDDPKDHVAEFEAQQRGTREALRLYREGEKDAAVRVLRPLDASPLASFNVSYYLGRCLVELGRHAEAVPPLEKAVELAPKVGQGYVYLADAQRGAGRLEAAETTLERGLEVAPENAELTFARGRLLLDRGQLEGARTLLERARGLDPEDPRSRVALADLLRRQGRPERARAEAAAAVELRPDWAAGHVAHGLALGSLGREAEAGRAFREALRLEPDQPDALFFLAAVEARAGRGDSAAPLLERLLAGAPDYPGARELLGRVRSTGAPPSGDLVPLRLIRVGSRERAEAARRRLAAGETFARVARELSEDPSAADGGELGAVRLDDLAAPLGKAAATLGPGEVSGVLPVGEAFFILGRAP